jgi:hypothetical protein
VGREWVETLESGWKGGWRVLADGGQKMGRGWVNGGQRVCRRWLEGGQNETG